MNMLLCYKINLWSSSVILILPRSNTKNTQRKHKGKSNMYLILNTHNPGTLRLIIDPYLC